MSTLRICVYTLLIGCVLLSPAIAYADHPPETYLQADGLFPHRRNALVKRLIKKLEHKHKWKLEVWNWPEEAREYISVISAIIWVLSHPSDFMSGPDDAYNKLQKQAGYPTWSSDNYNATVLHWIPKIHNFFDGIFYAASADCASTNDVGTKCDYDFILVALANLIPCYSSPHSKTSRN